VIPSTRCLEKGLQVQPEDDFLAVTAFFCAVGVLFVADLRRLFMLFV
jgi:hypothetical protein